MNWRSLAWVFLLGVGCTSAEKQGHMDEAADGYQAYAPAEERDFEAERAPLFEPPQDLGLGYALAQRSVAKPNRRAKEAQAKDSKPAGWPPARPLELNSKEPVLIHHAELHLGVYKVAASQKAIISLARKHEGFLAHQDDRQVTIRIPSRRFQQALEAIENTGDLIHRTIEVLDVSEEYHDLRVRLRNTEAVRDRLEKILERANTVKDALHVHRELAKLTETIEQIKGRLTLLRDRIAFSTILCRFRPLPRELLKTQPKEPRVELPFPWLYELGLSSLLATR